MGSDHPIHEERRYAQFTVFIFSSVLNVQREKTLRMGGVRAIVGWKVGGRSSKEQLQVRATTRVSMPLTFTL